MFKRESIDSLTRKLKNSFFTEHAFSVTESSDIYLSIVFRPRKSFFFEVRPNPTEGGYLITWAPGEDLVSEERTAAETVYAIGLKIERWLEFIKAETTPEAEGDTDVDLLRKTFFKSLSEIVPDKDEPFSSGERDALLARLTALEERLNAALVRQNASEEKIDELRKLFVTIGSGTKTNSKSTWIYAMGGRLLNYMTALAKTEQGKQLVYDSFKKLTNG